MFKLIDAMDELRKRGLLGKTTAIINPGVASAATLISLSCDEVIMTKNSHFMIHELKSMSYGSFSQLNSYQGHLENCHDRIVSIYKTHSNLKVVEIEKLLRKETWLNAKQAKKMGFVSKII